jgi:hypothetical protein
MPCPGVGGDGEPSFIAVVRRWSSQGLLPLPIKGTRLMPLQNGTKCLVRGTNASLLVFAGRPTTREKGTFVGGFIRPNPKRNGQWASLLIHSMKRTYGRFGMTLRDWDISHRSQAFLLGTLGFEVKQDREELIDPSKAMHRFVAASESRSSTEAPSSHPLQSVFFLCCKQASKHKHG